MRQFTCVGKEGVLICDFRAMAGVWRNFTEVPWKREFLHDLGFDHILYLLILNSWRPFYNSSFALATTVIFKLSWKKDSDRKI